MSSNKKFTEEIFNDFFISNDMIHMGYTAKKVSDIVNHFSLNNLEVVNESFSGWFEGILPYMPKDKNVIMEISGAEFSEKEQKTISDAIWNYYHGLLAKTRKKIRNECVQEIWIAVSFVLSCIFLFQIRSSNLTILQDQYAALPFWFFGYRLLDFLVLGIYPSINEKRYLEQMASMKVIFSGVNPNNEIPEDKVEEYSREIIANRQNKLASDYRELGKIIRSCGNKAISKFQVESMEDIVPTCNVPGYELADPGFGQYIEDMVELFPENTEIEVHIEGVHFSDDEKNTIKRALSNSLYFTDAHVNDSLRDNLRRVVIFLICLIGSSVLMNRGINIADTVGAETIYMLFWFFADYLIQYIILDPIENLREKRKLNQLENATLIFDD